jgi:hypothetical protein
MNRKTRRRAIWLLERRHLLRNTGHSRADGTDSFRFSLDYPTDGVAPGNAFLLPYGELQPPSNR